MPTKRFSHDCKKCRLLNIAGRFDIYVCGPSGPSNAVLVARYGNVDFENYSYDIDLAFSIAQKREEGCHWYDVFAQIFGGDF